MLDKIQDTELEVLKAYALDPPVELFVLPEQGNSTQNRGVKSSSGEYILRTHHGNAGAVLYEHRLLQWLADKNLPFAVPIPIATKDGATLLQASQGLYSLSLRLPGVRLNRHDLAHVAKMGSALGELHKVLAQYEPLTRPGVTPIAELENAHPLLPEPFALTPKSLHLASTLDNEYLFGWWREELAYLGSWIGERYHHLPPQVIHHDFIPNNVLVDAERVIAILDFEFATYDLRVLDFAIALRNVLRPWENLEPWEIVGQFCSGYRQRIKLHEEEIEAIPSLIRLRNIWLVLRRIGNALAKGEPFLGLQQIEYAQGFAQWLVDHEQVLKQQFKIAFS